LLFSWNLELTTQLDLHACYNKHQPHFPVSQLLEKRLTIIIATLSAYGVASPTIKTKNPSVVLD